MIKNAPFEKISQYLVIVLVALIPLLFLSSAYDSFLSLKIFLLRAISASLLIIILVRYFRERLKNPLKNPLIIIATVFIVIEILATVFSIDPLASVIGLRKRYFGLSTYVALYAVFLAIAAGSWSRQSISTLIKVIVFSAAAVSLIGIGQVFGITFPKDLTQNFGTAAYSTLGNPNFLGIYLAIALPLSLALFYENDVKNKYYRPVVLSITIILLIGIILTKSSGSVFGAIVALISFYVVFYRPWEKLGRAKSTIAIIAALLIIATSVFVFVSIDSSSMLSRIRSWSGIGKMISSRPVLGFGPDAIARELPKHQTTDKIYSQEIYHDAHNVLLTVAATSGLAGLAAFMAMLFFALKNLWMARRNESFSIYLAAGLIAAIAGYLSAEMINPDNIVPATLLWVILGLSASLTRLENNKNHNSRAWIVMALPFGFVAIFLVALAFKNLSAEVYLAEAEQQQSYSSAVMSYHRAQSVFPYYSIYYVRLNDRLGEMVRQGNSQSFELSETAVKKAIQIAPLEADNYVALGTLYLSWAPKAGKSSYHNAAISNYKKALEINPLNLFATYDLAFAFAKSKKDKQAEVWLKRYREIAPAEFSNALEEKVNKLLE